MAPCLRMVLPVGLPSFAEALRAGTEIFHALKSVLKGKGLNTAVGDEGGFAPNLRSNIEALDTILEAVGKTGYKIGSDILLGLDVASSEFFKDGKYDLEGEGKVFTPEQWVDTLASWAKQYPIVTIEDGMCGCGAGRGLSGTASASGRGRTSPIASRNRRLSSSSTLGGRRVICSS